MSIAINGLDLSTTSTPDLELLLKNELYMDIDSVFADELISELESRKEVSHRT